MKWNKIFNVSVATAAVAAALAAPGQASAQQTPVAANNGNDLAGASIGDIVVTARKREERLLDVPVAAAAVNAAAIERAGTTISAISTLIPSLQIAQGGSGNGGSITIRGVSSSSSNGALEQAVAVSIDGVQTSRGRILLQGFFDLDNIQVLKGPQALFFGKNSPAGVISLDSKNPGHRLEGYLRAGYEVEAQEYTAEGAISVPISDNFRIRVAGRYADMTGGFLHNDAQAIFNPLWKLTNPAPANPDLPGERGWLTRLTAIYDPGTKFDAKLKTMFGLTKSDSETPARQTVCAAGVTHSLTTGGLIDPFDDCRLNGHTSYGQLPPAVTANYPGSNGGVYFSRFRSNLSSLTMNYRPSAVTLTSVTGYVNYRSTAFGDASGSVYAAFSGLNDEKFDSFSQEFRAASSFSGPLNFTLGALYEQTHRTFGIEGLLASGVPADPRNGYSQTYTNRLIGNGSTYSAFVQASYKILPTVELAGGVRYTKDKRSGSVTNTFVNQNFAALARTALLAEGVVLHASPTANNWSPEATLSWHVQPNLMVYAAYKTGYLSGGITAPSVVSGDLNNHNISFLPETAKGGEIGLKFRTADHLLSGDVTAYYYIYNQLQVSAFNATTLSVTLGNAAKERTRGIDATLELHPVQNLTLRLSGNYNESNFQSFAGAQCYGGQNAATGCISGRQNLSGRPLPRAPRFVASGGFDWKQPLTTDWTLGIASDLRYTTKYFYVEPLNPTGLQGAFATLNGEVHISSSLWDFAVIGRNITNKYYGVYGIDKPRVSDGSILAIIGRPREVIFRVTRNF